ncbi:undecaprenyl-diphosphate phosphatase [Pelagicoccus sp. SDUM812003]|uniref:undecaprenyl-diphosphate phosphatase n=1 Tax=Pelagicoccus sp. SDUM812003 TaxID=3041267 RepID=UPI00280DB34B|nr:undecaprenyl-diphosphate phosphatase [Pelagicoccus sp. SDUM812003]MDQ8201723.1 undecaprenyl-diphosphate phosphatase [Pelagicoccus sp. SDUM812003]
MSLLESIILGIIQGLTEFLPVSSSGHLELGKVILGIETTEDVSFTVVVHGATVLSTIAIFWRDILGLFRGLFSSDWNESKRYIAMLLFSSLPVIFIGLFFKEEVESLFNGNVLLVGSMLLLTGCLLSFTYYTPKEGGPVTFKSALIIGISQAIAVMPGISRSGSTIATALLLGVDKAKAARFSFLMVLIPIIGANCKDILDGGMAESTVGAVPLIAGFIAAFISGVLACRWMISIVTRGKLIYFAIYCFIVGTIAIGAHFLA